ncbi:thiaminase II [Bacteroidales bacterium OttesenSCG-928-I14]|nr:thiaminase II [Bacteroidales bacterium OttesenSCG-928-I14]
MKWSEQTWDTILPIYEKILQLPFIQELAAGTLNPDKFVFYIRQDAAYLSDYGRVLAIIASKLNDPKHSEAFINFAGDSIATENALHASFVNELKDGHAIEASPTCLLYTSFLLSQLANAPVEVMAASVLPCFWIYKEVGDYILSVQTPNENPYQDWIDTYGGEDFEKSTKLAISICDQLAEKCTDEQRDSMTKAFVMAAKMEWMFWDSAYKQEEWSI